MMSSREPQHTGPASGQAGLPAQYDENGVDLSLIRMNMRLTPTERARRADRARRDALRLAESGRATRRQSACSLLELEAIKRLREQEGL